MPPTPTAPPKANKRLPTTDEWEFAGQASQTRINGTAEPGYNRTILDWYAEGSRKGLRDVGKSKPNYWGIHDMHGLIWEWTEDFNSSLLTSVSAAGSNMFCSGASAGSGRPERLCRLYALRHPHQPASEIRAQQFGLPLRQIKAGGALFSLC